MLLEKEIRDTFLNLFYHEITDHDLGGTNKLNLFILKISNNSFNYGDLAQELADYIVSFSLSRTEQERLHTRQGGKRYTEAVNRLRNYAANDGEFGEILLYCFLEAHLSAPKILSKLELKTAKNDYVKGADGVHLLKLNESSYQLVYGESKLDADIKVGISHAFTSIIKFLSENDRKNFEDMLVRSNIVKEAVDDATYEFLKSILVPSERPQEVDIDGSFGIFLGFDFTVPDDKKMLGNNEFRKYVKERIKAEVLDCVDTIKKQISKEDLHGYNFYLYAVPFTDLATLRKDMIKKITTP